MYRRNQSFSLTAPEPRAAAASRSMAKLTVLGIVVNPRNKEPVLVTTDGAHVGIRGLLADRVGFRHGHGYYDTSGHGKSKEIESTTGYPRSHTPSGVTPRGAGYGTSLYTAMSLGAYLVATGEASVRMDVEGEGISSESEGRSYEADRWWDAAHDKGLTDRKEEETEEKEEDVDIDIDADDLQNCVSLDEGQSLDYVNRVSVDILTTTTLTIDTYPYYNKYSNRAAWNNDLVIAEFYMQKLDDEIIPEDLTPGSELRWLTEQAAEEPDFFGDINNDALLALDVRHLDKQTMRLLSLCYAANGLKDKDIDAMWLRWSHDLDPEAAAAQQHLFSPNGRAAALSDVVEARNNVPWKRLASLP